MNERHDEITAPVLLLPSTEGFAQSMPLGHARHGVRDAEIV
jgi:hypothetical protein